jgi:hypothetical protein
MSTRKSLLNVVTFVFAFFGAQYVWAQQVQDVNIVDQNEAVKVKIKHISTSGGTVPVTVDNREPFQIDLPYTPFSGGGVALSFVVPEGKRLVIEYVSGDALLSADAGIVSAFSITTYSYGGYVPHGLNYVDRGPTGPWASRYDAAQMTRLYADPQTDVRIGVVTSLGGDGQFAARVSGYLVPD